MEGDKVVGGKVFFRTATDDTDIGVTAAAGVGMSNLRVSLIILQLLRTNPIPFFFNFLVPFNLPPPFDISGELCEGSGGNDIGPVTFQKCDFAARWKVSEVFRAAAEIVVDDVAGGDAFHTGKDSRGEGGEGTEADTKDADVEGGEVIVGEGLVEVVWLAGAGFGGGRTDVRGWDRWVH